MNAGPTLIVGASGLLGSYLTRLLLATGADVLGTGHRRAEGRLPLDITRAREVRALLEDLRPRTVVLAAALTDVDGCEREPERSHAVNAAGARHVAEAAAGVGARLVYVSTDYVFDGARGPYAESDPPDPLCVYGRHKLEGERSVRELLGGRHLIVRTAGLFGWEAPPRNFVARLIALNRRGQQLRVPTDQVGSPTFAGDLAAALAALERSAATGTFHVAGRTLLSRYDFALLAAGVFGLRRELIVPATTAELGQQAPRPLRGGLRVGKAEAFLRRRLATVHEALDAMRREVAR